MVSSAVGMLLLRGSSSKVTLWGSFVFKLLRLEDFPSSTFSTDFKLFLRLGAFCSSTTVFSSVFRLFLRDSFSFKLFLRLGGSVSTFSSDFRLLLRFGCSSANFSSDFKLLRRDPPFESSFSVESFLTLFLRCSSFGCSSFLTLFFRCNGSSAFSSVFRLFLRSLDFVLLRRCGSALVTETSSTTIKTSFASVFDKLCGGNSTSSPLFDSKIEFQ